MVAPLQPRSPLPTPFVLLFNKIPNRSESSREAAYSFSISCLFNPPQEKPSESSERPQLFFSYLFFI